MTESRLGLGWNPALLLWWCEEGRIKVANALLTKSPSTVPIRTREFVIADLRAFSRWFDEYETDWLLVFLWRLHRNEPGCVLGEHRQVFLLVNELVALLFFTTWFLDEAENDLFGDIGRSIGNRTEDEERLFDFLKKPVELSLNLELWEPKDEDEAIVDEQNLPESDIVLCKLYPLVEGRIGPLVLVLDEAAIVVSGGNGVELPRVTKRRARKRWTSFLFL